MDIKETLKKYAKNITSFWKTGKIQRIAHITYEVGWNIVLFFLLVGLIALFFAGGIGAGYFASLVKDEPIRSYDEMEEDIYDYEETSKLYFAGDKQIGNIKSDLHREEVDLEDISDSIIQATKATEDQNFESHKGVVPKAVVRAVAQEAVNSDARSGGSTLTQQLIKNQLLTNEVSFERKAKEMLLALRLENFFTKDQILEAYLNIIPYGREASGQNIAGIQAAAQGVFGTDADDVNIPQAAFLAGLPQNPIANTPFANDGDLKDKENIQLGIQRMKTVLKRMYDEEYITEDEYEDALDYDIVDDFTEESTTPDEEYPILVKELKEEAKDIILDNLLEEDDLKEEDLDEQELETYKEQAEKDLLREGYHIHSTIDQEIYETQQEVAEDYEDYGPDTEGTVIDDETGEEKEVEQPVQTAAVLRENDSGKIISFVGGRNTDDDSEFNFATQAERQTGSTIKPLLDYGPAMDLGEVQPGTPIADLDTTDYNKIPKNYGGGTNGIVPARDALAHSYNKAATKVYQDIESEDPLANYLDKMGIETKETDYVPRAAIGDEPHMSVDDNVNAFTTFANEGDFIDGYMIESIETNDGDVIHEHENDSVDVFSEQTVYLTLDLMRDVISDGTAAYLNSQLDNTDVDWAGKTGTSGEYRDAWFVGTNPNVTFGTWIGYEDPKNLQDECPNCSLSYSQRNNKLWAELINATAEVDSDLMSPSDDFEKPDGVVEKSYCAISGMKPSKLCEKAGLVKSDIFNEEYAPDEEDDSLIKGEFVKVDGKSVKAGDDTPEEFIDGDGYMFDPDFLEENNYDELDDIKELFPESDREKWEKIGIPDSDLGDTDALEDDGEKPDAPSSLKHSDGSLSWNKSDSKDVVGYYIYKADKEGGDFEKSGDTTDTDYDVDDDSVYKVKAVDYFGLESSSSKEVTVGDVDDDEDEDDEDEDDEDDEDNDENEDDDEDNDEDNNENDEDNNNENDNNDENNSENDNDE